MNGNAFSPALHDWARKRGIRAADEFMAGDGCDRDAPAAFFDAVCSREPLLRSMRATAETAFMARVDVLEGDHG